MVIACVLFLLAAWQQPDNRAAFIALTIGSASSPHGLEEATNESSARYLVGAQILTRSAGRYIWVGLWFERHPVAGLIQLVIVLLGCWAELEDRAATGRW